MVVVSSEDGVAMAGGVLHRDGVQEGAQVQLTPKEEMQHGAQGLLSP
jgi:hypothetical protein